MRRLLLTLIIFILCIAPLPACSGSTKTSEIDVAGRKVRLSIWEPAKPQGVIIFSHGAGGSPEPSYNTLMQSWKAAGFLIVAPLHTDSTQHPDRFRSLLTRIADDDAAMLEFIKLVGIWAFPTRIADVAAAQGWAAKAAPDLPYAYAGYSLGALIAMIRGGATIAMVHARDPQAKAVLAFSSPGLIPELGMMGPDSYQGLAVPLLLVTGDKDIVPPIITDPVLHLAAFEGSRPGDKYAWIGKGVDHSLPQHDLLDPAFAEAAALSINFLKAHVLGDPEAQAALRAVKSSDRAEVRSR